MVDVVVKGLVGVVGVHVLLGMVSVVGLLSVVLWLLEVYLGIW